MRQDLLLSFLLHFVVIIAMVVSAPFKARVNTDLGDVIRVNLTSLPASLKPQAQEPVAVPTPIVADDPVVPITEVASVTQAKPLPKPKPKPEEKKDDTYRPKTETGDQDRSGIENGQKDVSENLSSGSKFGGAAVDNASFDYPYWFVQAFGKIERNWTNPVYANRPISCVIYFQVIRSGRIIKVEIEESSGVDAFDRACERAVNLSQPLPPLPDDFADEIIGIHLTFPYSPG
jgi:TonB family protein